MTYSAKRVDLLAGGDVPPVRTPARLSDPYQALDDLMVAVEALCPVWPPREPLRSGPRMLL
jgi:hypothetical protein